MYQVQKSHEQRIADLERQVAELQRIVGVQGQIALVPQPSPSIPVGGHPNGNVLVGLGQQMGLAQQNR